MVFAPSSRRVVFIIVFFVLRVVARESHLVQSAQLVRRANTIRDDCEGIFARIPNMENKAGALLLASITRRYSHSYLRGFSCEHTLEITKNHQPWTAKTMKNRDTFSTHTCTNNNPARDLTTTEYTFTTTPQTRKRKTNG